MTAFFSSEQILAFIAIVSVQTIILATAAYLWTLFYRRNPAVQSTAWRIALFGSLAAPVLTGLGYITNFGLWKVPALNVQKSIAQKPEDASASSQKNFTETGRNAMVAAPIGSKTDPMDSSQRSNVDSEMLDPREEINRPRFDAALGDDDGKANADASARSASPASKSKQIDSEKSSDSAPYTASESPSPASENSKSNLVTTSIASFIGIWLCGSAIMIIRLAMGIVRLRSIRQLTTPLNEASSGSALQSSAELAKNRLGLESSPQIAEHPDAATPLVLGVLKPIVVLPEGLAQQASQEILLDVLVHEFAHVKQRDPLVCLLQRIAAALYWPNPAIHAINASLGRAREELCDNYVLVSRDAHLYASTLLQLSQYPSSESRRTRDRSAQISANRVPGVLALEIFPPQKLEHRISRMLDERRSKTTTPTRFSLAALAASFLSVLTLASVSGSAPVRPMRSEPAAPSFTTSENSSPENLPFTDTNGREAQQEKQTKPIENPRQIDVKLVIAETQEPVANGLIIVYLDGDEISKLHTDAQGKAKFLLDAPMEKTLVARIHGPGAVPIMDYWKPAKAPGAESRTITLDAGTKIGGVVVDEAGKPVAGVELGVDAEVNSRQTRRIDSYYTLKTDIHGKWSCDEAPANIDEIHIRTRSPDFAGDQRILTGRPEIGPSPTIEEYRKGAAKIILKRGMEITGTVRDSRANPLEGVAIRAFRVTNGTPLFETSTQKDGTYKLRFLPGNELSVIAIKDGFAPELVSVNEVLKDRPTTIEPIVLRPGRILQGQVVDETGAPIARAHVSLSRWRTATAASIWSGRTDENGRFSWNSAPMESVEFYVSAADHSAKRDVRWNPSEKSLTIRLNSERNITLRVLDDRTQTPVRKFYFAYGQQHKDGRRYWQPEFAMEDENGEFRVRASAAIEFQVLRVSAPNKASAVISFEDLMKQKSAMVVRLKEKQSQPNGRVVANRENSVIPVEGATVYYVGKSSGLTLENLRPKYGQPKETAATGRDGTFQFSSNEELERAIVVHDLGFTSATRETLASSQDIVLKPWAQIHGKAILAGKPQKGLEVTTSSLIDSRTFGANFHVTAKTDEHGEFLLEKVLPAKTQVSLVQNSSQRTMLQMLKIEAISGQKVEVALGGSGRAVTGRFAVPKSAIREGDPNPWPLRGDFGVRPAIPFPKDMTDPKVRTAWQEQWRASPEGRAYYDNYKGYPISLVGDYAFRIEDVQPGRYTLHANFHDGIRRGMGDDMLLPILGSVQLEFEVPALPVGEKYGADVALGDVPVKATVRLRTGDIAPDFTAETFEGKKISKAEFHGKPILLIFAALDSYTGGNMLREQFPDIVDLARQFVDDRGGEVAWFSMDQKKESWETRTKDLSLKGHKIQIGSYPKHKIAADYGALLTPHIFLIGADGKVQAVSINSQELRKALGGDAAKKVTSKRIPTNGNVGVSKAGIRLEEPNRLTAQGPMGRVVAKQGNSALPVDGAVIYFSGKMAYVSLENLKPAAVPNQPQSKEIATTDKDGMFGFPSDEEFDAGFVVHNLGYATVTRKSLANSREVELLPWARIHGTAMLAGKLLAGETIVSHAWVKGESREFSFKFTTTTNEKGEYTFGRFLPGQAQINLERNLPKPTWLQTKKVIAIAGQTVEAPLGGSGRAVVGRFAIPKSAIREGDPNPWPTTEASVHPAIPYPKAMTDQKARSDWHNEWVRSPDGRAFFDKYRIYPVPLSGDYSFRIEDVEPGAYVLLISFSERIFLQRGVDSAGGVIPTYGTARHEFEVPAVPAGEKYGEQVNVGDVPVKPTARLRPGDAAPDFTAQTIDGQQITKTDVQGKATLLIFANFDSHSQRNRDFVRLQLPEIAQLARSLKQDRSGDVIWFCTDVKDDSFKKYLESLNLAGHRVFLGSTTVHKIAADYGAILKPYMLLIGADGKVQSVPANVEQLRKSIEAMPMTRVVQSPQFRDVETQSKIRNDSFEGTVLDDATGKPMLNFQIHRGTRDNNGSIYWHKTAFQDQIYQGSVDGQFSVKVDRNDKSEVYRVVARGMTPVVVDFATPQPIPSTFRLKFDKALNPRFVYDDDGTKRNAGNTLVYFRMRNPDMERPFTLENWEAAPRGYTAPKSEANDEGVLVLTPSWNFESLFAVHPKGYFHASRELLNKKSGLTLVPWSKLKGKVILSGKPAAKQWVRCIDMDSQPVKGMQLAYRTQTDQNGEFTFDQIYPGKLKVFREINNQVYKGNHESTVAVAAGEVASVTLGGSGTTIVGRFVTPKHAIKPGDPNPWPVLRYHNLPQINQSLPYPPGMTDMMERTQWRYNVWNKSPQARKFYAEENRTYGISVAPDHSFQIEDVQPGRYQLYADFGHSPPKDPRDVPRVGAEFGHIRLEFEVPPIPEGRTNGDTIDLGDLAIVPTVRLTPGDPAPTFEAVDMDGKKVSLSDYLGKTSLVIFWRSDSYQDSKWNQEIAELSHEKAQSHNLQLLGFCRDYDATKSNENWKNNFPWRNVHLGIFRTKISNDFGAEILPAMYLIGPDGKIKALANDADSLKKALAAAFPKK